MSQANMTPGRGSTRRWRTLRATVLAEEPTCRLRLPGICTHAATTVDHLIPVITSPELEYERTNLVGSCAPCNLFKGIRPLAVARAAAAAKHPPRPPAPRPAALGFFD